MPESRFLFQAYISVVVLDKCEIKKKNKYWNNFHIEVYLGHVVLVMLYLFYIRLCEYCYGM